MNLWETNQVQTIAPPLFTDPWTVLTCCLFQQEEANLLTKQGAVLCNITMYVAIFVTFTVCKQASILLSLKNADHARALWFPFGFWNVLYSFLPLVIGKHYSSFENAFFFLGLPNQVLLFLQISTFSITFLGKQSQNHQPESDHF